MIQPHIFSVNKSFHKLPTAHCQFQDVNPDGTYGACRSLHGYDRSVNIQVSCAKLDDYGWVYGFGGFKAIRKFLEYYFDHTSVFPANDPRIEAIVAEMNKVDSFLGTARVLPSGVSMEMSALFLFDQANQYIYESSDGRCAITKIEFREHDSNQGQLEIDFAKSYELAQQSHWAANEQLVMKPVWDYESPTDAVKRILN